MTATKQTTALVAVTIGLAISGCGSDKTATTSSTDVDYDPSELINDGPSADTTASTDSATTTGTPFKPVVTYRARLQSEGKLQVPTTIEIGKLQPASTDLPGGFAPLASACDIDPQTSAVIPIRLSYINPSKRFDARAIPMFKVADPAQTGQLEMGSDLEETGTSCDSVDAANTITTTIQPASTGELTMLLVIGRYYTPAHPDGQPSMIRKLSGRIGMGSPTPLKCLSGPGIYDGWFSLTAKQPVYRESKYSSTVPTC